MVWGTSFPGSCCATEPKGTTHNLVVVGSSPTRPTIVEFLTYHLSVPEIQPLEDERGVDTAQIRALLRLSPAERCAHMVEVANTMLAIREHAQAART